MRIAPQVVLTREQRAKLEVYARGRSTPTRVVLRARRRALPVRRVGTAHQSAPRSATFVGRGTCGASARVAGQ